MNKWLDLGWKKKIWKKETDVHYLCGLGNPLSYTAQKQKNKSNITLGGG